MRTTATVVFNSAMTAPGRWFLPLLLVGLGGVAGAADANALPAATSAAAALPAVAGGPAPPPPAAPAQPSAVPPSAWRWRVTAGVGMARERLHYTASAHPSSPVQAGYAGSQASAAPDASCATAELMVTALHGLSRRGPGDGLVYGYELTLAEDTAATMTLPVADADQSSFSRNGTSFTSSLSSQALAFGMPVGWAWQVGPRWSWTALGAAHVGLTHIHYTSGENEVYGRNAPLNLYANDLVNLSYDLGARAGCSYQAGRIWSLGAELGCRYGRSLSGSTTDQVVFYQGAANAQPGTFSERIRLTTEVAYLTLGIGGRF